MKLPVHAFQATTSLFLFFSFLRPVLCDVPIVPRPQSTTPSKLDLFIENQLEFAAQTHEVLQVFNSSTILVSQQSNSVLVKAQIDSLGRIQSNDGSRYFQLGSGPDTGRLHGLFNSIQFPGKVWITLQGDNKLLLIDPVVSDVNASPIVVQEILVPVPGKGPHYIGEYGDELWCTLQDSYDVLRINFKNTSDYTIYRGKPAPVFVAKHAVNGLFYAGLDASNSIMKIDPINNVTSFIPVSPVDGVTGNQERTPVGLISGPGGIWFSLLGSNVTGTGTIGFLDQNDGLKFFKLKSVLGQNAGLLHLAFGKSKGTTAGNVLWVLASSIVNVNGLDMLIKLTFDSSWNTITEEKIMVLPTQGSKAHRIFVTESTVFASELATSKLLAYNPDQ